MKKKTYLAICPFCGNKLFITDKAENLELKCMKCNAEMDINMVEGHVEYTTIKKPSVIA